MTSRPRFTAFVRIRPDGAVEPDVKTDTLVVTDERLEAVVALARQPLELEDDPHPSE